MRLVRLLLTAAIGLGLASVAHADTLTEVYTFANLGVVTNTDESPFGVLEFDPGLGTLLSTTETIAGNINLMPTGPDPSFYFNTENGVNYTGTQSGPFSVSGIVTGYESGSPGIPNYRESALDYRPTDATFTTVGPVTVTFDFDYTPAATAVTPEPSSLLLLGSGLAAATALTRRRTRPA